MFFLMLGAFSTVFWGIFAVSYDPSMKYSDPMPKPVIERHDHRNPITEQWVMAVREGEGPSGEAAGPGGREGDRRSVEPTRRGRERG